MSLVDDQTTTIDNQSTSLLFQVLPLEMIEKILSYVNFWFEKDSYGAKRTCKLLYKILGKLFGKICGKIIFILSKENIFQLGVPTKIVPLNVNQIVSQYSPLELAYFRKSYSSVAYLFAIQPDIFTQQFQMYETYK